MEYPDYLAAVEDSLLKDSFTVRKDEVELQKHNLDLLAYLFEYPERVAFGLMATIVCGVGYADSVDLSRAVTWIDDFRDYGRDYGRSVPLPEHLLGKSPTHMMALVRVIVSPKLLPDGAAFVKDYKPSYAHASFQNAIEHPVLVDATTWTPLHRETSFRWGTGSWTKFFNSVVSRYFSPRSF